MGGGLSLEEPVHQGHCLHPQGLPVAQLLQPPPQIHQPPLHLAHGSVGADAIVTTCQQHIVSAGEPEVPVLLARAKQIAHRLRV